MTKERNIYGIISLLILVLALIDFFIKTDIAPNITIGDISFMLFIVFYFIFNQKIPILSSNIGITTSLYFFYFLGLGSILIIIGTSLTYLSYLYIIKEIIYLFTFFIIVKSYSINYYISKKITLIIVLSSLIYGMISIVTGNIAHYGISSIVSASPSQSGVVFLSCMFISIIFVISERKKTYVLLSVISAFAVIATISRTAILGLGIFILTFIGLSFLRIFTINLKKKQTIMFIISSALMFITVYILLKINLFEFKTMYVDKTIERFSNISRSLATRQNMSSDYFNTIIGDSGLKLLFGQGKAIPEITFNRSTLGVDNQYTRFIIEGGMIGLTLWIMMIISWTGYLRKTLNKIQRMFLYSFLASYLAMGLGYEVFQVTKSGVLFWLILGILYCTSKYNKKQFEPDNKVTFK